jgi:hypothetical protein
MEEVLDMTEPIYTSIVEKYTSITVESPRVLHVAYATMAI